MSEVLTLKKSNCKNCHKCIRHCPVKAISFSGNQAHIMTQDCILCGQCFVVCPQNAKEVVNDTDRVRKLIADGHEVYVSLAPSYIANYDDVGIEAMRAALKKLGFADAEETAIGATIVKREYERLISEEHRDVIITSCCHSVNLLIQKYYPELTPCLADVLSPMQAHCKDIKRRHPEAKTVFIGPCVSKKDEIDKYPGIVDVVLTFEELSNWFASEHVVPEKKLVPMEYSRARLFPTTGGVLKTLSFEDPGYTYLAVDGTENCRNALEDIQKGNIHKCFIEMSACSGSCIGGPILEKYHKTPIHEYIAVNAFAGKKDFEVDQPDSTELRKIHHYTLRPVNNPSEEEIRAALKKLGKTKPTDELNCGTCGYNTCRDKAIAICRGIAEPSMCLPYLKERAESFSGSLVNNSPFGIVVLNSELNIQQINITARKIFEIPANDNMKDVSVTAILDPNPFLEVIETRKTHTERAMYLEDLNKYISMTIFYDSETDLTTGTFQDVTESQLNRQKKEALNKQTIETADALVEKQMRIVQEIASLLGETTAETKIALTRLKESVENNK